VAGTWLYVYFVGSLCREITAAAASAVTAIADAVCPTLTPATVEWCPHPLLVNTPLRHSDSLTRCKLLGSPLSIYAAFWLLAACCMDQDTPGYNLPPFHFRLSPSLPFNTHNPDTAAAQTTWRVNLLRIRSRTLTSQKKISILKSFASSILVLLHSRVSDYSRHASRVDIFLV